MFVHFAVVLHEYGSTGFAAFEHEDLLEEIDKWVKENGGTDRESYFEDHPDEILFIHAEKVYQPER